MEDSGIGFDEVYLDRIFRPFQRLHGKDGTYEGTGMGCNLYHPSSFKTKERGIVGEEKESVVILMADDDEDDCILVKHAIRESGFPNELYFVLDGEELMDYLFQRAEHSDPSRSPRPDLILLDLNMPRKDGREALREIKSDPALKSIPVVILTTSSEESDKVLTRELGACSFITKPSSFQELVQLFQRHIPVWINAHEGVDRSGVDPTVVNATR